MNYYPLLLLLFFLSFVYNQHRPKNEYNATLKLNRSQNQEINQISKQQYPILLHRINQCLKKATNDRRREDVTTAPDTGRDNPAPVSMEGAGASEV
ncbi:hypothetical protein P3X46_009289 [Hevea brasiliensis]|uniref:Secreted protein n=1 Tax=Hevea brasiliensis TaxID=3981 RepID=A0ABQ9MNA0_HEVBR|nr:hypothetical protein P3X46_009289 [Hevea brasiliensis]